MVASNENWSDAERLIEQRHKLNDSSIPTQLVGGSNLIQANLFCTAYILIEGIRDDSDIITRWKPHLFAVSSELLHDNRRIVTKVSF